MSSNASDSSEREETTSQTLQESDDGEVVESESSPKHSNRSEDESEDEVEELTLEHSDQSEDESESEVEELTSDELESENELDENRDSSRNVIVQREINISGIPVEFPGVPYPTQQSMMENIIAGLQARKNNLVESPTGSGKTLAILCAVLAWRKSLDPKIKSHKIYYLTRTHSQASGVVKELRKTVYAKGLKMTILGSRRQMCINEEFLSQGESVNPDDLCKSKRNIFKRNEEREEEERERGKRAKSDPEEPVKVCPFYRGRDTGKFGASCHGVEGVNDIEDFRKVGKGKGYCPYYTTMYLHKDADLVICPYNYVISPYLRKTCGIELNESILIFDEGHNLEKACCQEASISVKLSKVAKIIHGWDQAILAMLNKTNKQCYTGLVEDVSALIIGMISFRDMIKTNCGIQRVSMKSNQEILTTLESCGMGQSDVYKYSAVLRSLSEAENEAAKNLEESCVSAQTLQNTNKLLNVLKLLYKHCVGVEDDDDEEDDDEVDPVENGLKDYQLLFEWTKVETERVTRIEYEFHLFCMNPSVIFKEIEKSTTSITITSGTLAPLSTYSRELGVEFLNPLMLPQVVPRDRYIVAKLHNGVRGGEFTLTYERRSTQGVLLDLGDTLLRICQLIPNGVIVFVSSERYVKTLMKFWGSANNYKEKKLLARLRKTKHVFIDSKDATVRRNLEANFKKRSRKPKGKRNGAVLFSFFRGSMSEGVDFKDDEARAVVTLGIPFLPPLSAESQARAEYYKNQEKYWTWYQTDAFRALNQGLGRSIRHHNDWGSIIMIDTRFQILQFEELVPGWIRDAWKDYKHFAKLEEELKEFVTRMSNDDNEGDDDIDDE